ncbi:autoinducer binding domain-containing protein [Nitratireductor luteus]|uniref:autoinducer binding domain-containing protein n=1 Tax=Nitratireductor luteus TaxID=2976980 RepID=UPI00223F76D6|nr:autoinducer binding domain-containing protein [Nitratireductor luteus]
MTGEPVHRGVADAVGAELVGLIEDCNSVGNAVFGVRDRLAVEHVTYHCIARYPGHLHAPYIRSTYPAEWIARYVLEDYLNIDPVVLFGFETARPFFWHQLSLTPRQRELMQDSLTHGLGDAGIPSPLSADQGAPCSA